MKVNQFRSKGIILRFAKTLLQNAIAFVGVIALSSGFIACSDDSDEDSYVNQKLRVVAIPDFVFKSSNIVLSSTTNPVATRADKDYITFDNGERREVTDNVSVRLYVAADNDKFKNLRAWEDTEFRAVLLSINMCTPTDVPIFMPVSSKYFSYNNQRALDVMSMNYIESIHASKDISRLKTIYGEAVMTCMVSTDTVYAKLGFGKLENGTEGVEVTITGVTQKVINYLEYSFNDGLQIEIWNYFLPTISREALRDCINGSTIDFSKKPAIYVNEFKKAYNCTETVYSKVDENTGWYIPYRDEDCTEVLDEKYWVRPARTDGSPSKDYLLLCHQNEWDCNVEYIGTKYSDVQKNDADVPYDIETKYYKLPNNYNVYYYDK